MYTILSEHPRGSPCQEAILHAGWKLVSCRATGVEAGTLVAEALQKSRPVEVAVGWTPGPAVELIDVVKL